MRTVLVLFADGSEELEAVTVVNILRRAGVSVTLAGLNAGALRGSRGILLVPDATLDDAMMRSYDMVVLPGGQPGTDNLKADVRVLKLMQQMAHQGKYVTAICAARVPPEDANVPRRLRQILPAVQSKVVVSFKEK